MIFDLQAPQINRKIVKGMDTDMILINDKARPAVCKTYNARETLYDEFIERVVKKDTRMCKFFGFG